MKRFAIAVLITLALTSTACNQWVEPGHAGIVVNAAGSQRGVQDFPIKTGRVWYNPWNESVIEYPVFVQTGQWVGAEAITFSTADRMSVSADVAVAYQVLFEKVPNFYIKFRADNLDKDFTHRFLRIMAREKFSEVGGQYKIDQIMGNNAALLKAVRDSLQTDLDPYGVKLEPNGIGFIGTPRPPQAVIDAINNSTQATQNAITSENELRGVEAKNKMRVSAAEANARATVLEAEGQATANRKLADSITPTFVEYQRTIKWDGKLPQVTSGATPLLSLK